MTESIFDHINAAATRMGHCEPKWLKNREEPTFETYEQGTDGPEILLLHGLFGALSNWGATAPLMAEFARPIALQFPLLTGHRSEVKVKALAAFTEYFIRSRQLAPVTLCGNSMGGHVAMRLCLASPELVDCLVLSGSSGLYEHSVDTLPVRMGDKFVREHMGRVFHNQEFITDEAVDEIVQILASRLNTLNLIHAARSAKKDNLLSSLKDIKVPTLLLWGEDDEVTTTDVAQIFQKNLANSELVTVKNCGHAPMIEYPAWFAEQVQTFMEKNSRYFKKG